MGFILEPNKPGEDLIINGWNWRPTVAQLVREGVIPAGERAERCLANGCGGGLTADEAAATADMLGKLIATLTPRQRIHHDGSITDAPINYEKLISEWTEEDTYDHYSAKYEALKAFAEFCRESGGFTVH